MKINKFEEIFKSHLNSNIELTKKTFLNYSKVFKIFNFLHKKIKRKKKYLFMVMVDLLLTLLILYLS